LRIFYQRKFSSSLSFRVSQIDVALEDENRVIEKSRTSWEDSKRIDKGFTGGSVGSRFESDSNASTTGEDGDETNTNSKNNSRKFDPECYDDRPFYSMLLKVSQLSTHSIPGLMSFRLVVFAYIQPGSVAFRVQVCFVEACQHRFMAERSVDPNIILYPPPVDSLARINLHVAAYQSLLLY
jgi:hypothetical protein